MRHLRPGSAAGSGVVRQWTTWRQNRYRWIPLQPRGRLFSAGFFELKASEPAAHPTR